LAKPFGKGQGEGAQAGALLDGRNGGNRLNNAGKHAGTISFFNSVLR
jgi:hypothetical protein